MSAPEPRDAHLKLDRPSGRASRTRRAVTLSPVDTARPRALTEEGGTLDCNGDEREVPVKTTEARSTSISRTCWVVAMGGGIAMLACCSPILDVHGRAVGAVDVSRRSTFSVGETAGTPPRYVRSDNTDEVVRRAGLFAARILVIKGYTLDKDRPSDLKVRIGAGRREEAVASEFLMPRPSPNQTGRIETSELEDITAGALVIDVFDGVTGAMVWHGAARIVIDPAKIDDALLERATTAILATFPARAKSR